MNLEPVIPLGVGVKGFPFLSLTEDASSNQDVNEKGGDVFFLGLNQRATITTVENSTEHMSVNSQMQSPNRLYAPTLGEAEIAE